MKLKEFIKKLIISVIIVLISTVTISKGYSLAVEPYTVLSEDSYRDKNESQKKHY